MKVLYTIFFTAALALSSAKAEETVENEVEIHEKESGICSWYGDESLQGAWTACGDHFDMYAFTAAHKTLDCGTRITVRNDENGRTVDVVVNDRGPFVPGRILDLSWAAAQQLGYIDQGLTQCSY